MQHFKKIFYGLLIAAVVLCGILWHPAAAAAEELTILFTHDLHDHLRPYTVQIDGRITTRGGLGRLQTVINAEREADPQLLLVDAGDFSMGTLFQTIFASRAPQLRILGKMGFAATTFGNHEFDFRAEGLADMLNAAVDSGDRLPRITAANMVFPLDEEGKLAPSLEKLKKAVGRYPVEEYLVLERKGFKIGVFGLMGKDADSNAPMSEVEFSNAVDAAKRVAEILKTEEKVDLILCLSHAGTAGKSPKTEDEILAKEVPDIDVIISGHSHTVLEEPIIVGSTIIGSCGEYGMNLGIIKVSKVPGGRWALADYELRPIDESIPENEEILDIIDEYQELVQSEYLDYFGLEFDQVVARAPFSFTSAFLVGAEHKEEPLGSLIGDAYIYAVQQAEGENYDPIAAAVVPNGTIRGSFVQGDITVSDVFIVSSLGIGKDGIPGYPLVSVYLTGKELKTLCEVDASVTPIMGAAQLYVAGLKYTFNPNRLLFNKVTEAGLERPGGGLEEIEDGRLYRVVAGLYSGQMLPAVSAKSFGLLSLVPKTKEGEKIDDFEGQIILDYSYPGGREIKEWHAIVRYLQSFEPDADGVPVIPAAYSRAQGRKNIDRSKNPAALIKNPNKIALMAYLIVLVLAFGIGFAAVKIAKRQKAKRKRIRF